jgi:CBS domain-containing protein
MQELVDLLISDADMLPCEAAERISVRRIAASESDRTASDIMEAMPTIPVDETVQGAAAKLVQSGSSILAVVSHPDCLEGVVTQWDVTQATALGSPDDQPLKEVMTREVISAAPTDTILEMVRKLEHHEISAMPVVDQGTVVGMISSDLLATRSLPRLLQSQLDS